MKDCICGKPVRLRVMRVTVNRKNGITHWIEHMDSSNPCLDGDWSCVAFKPYPKAKQDKPFHKLKTDWDSAVGMPTEFMRE